MPTFEKDLIIFDLDGTLIDSSRDIALALNHTLAELGKPSLDYETIKKNIGWGVRPLIERVIPGADSGLIEHGREVFLRHYGNHLLVDTCLYDGALDVLDHFFRNGKLMAIATNKPMALTQGIIEGLTLEKYFVHVTAGDSFTNKKPHPEPLLAILSHARIEAARAIFVGDSVIDCETGVNAGVTTIGAGYGFRGRGELEAFGCGVIIDTIAELKGLVS